MVSCSYFSAYWQWDFVLAVFTLEVTSHRHYRLPLHSFQSGRHAVTACPPCRVPFMRHLSYTWLDVWHFASSLWLYAADIAPISKPIYETENFSDLLI